MSREPRTTAASPFSPAGDGVRVVVRLVPKARRNRVEGVVAHAEGEAVKVSVTEPPEGGWANAALVRLLAREWRLPATAFEILRGRADRRKVLLIRGDPAALRARLSAWAEGRGV